MVAAKALDEAVWKAVITLLETPDLIEAELEHRVLAQKEQDTTSRRMTELERERKCCQEQGHRLLDAYQEGLIDLDALTTCNFCHNSYLIGGCCNIDIFSPYHSTMASSVEERVGNLVEQHLGIADRALLDVPASELGVNSMDGVAFFKTVSEEFGIRIAEETAARFFSIRDLINYLESHTD